MSYVCNVLVLASMISITGCVDPGTMPTDEDSVGSVSATEPGTIEPERAMEHDEEMVAGTIELPLTMMSPAIADLAVRLSADERDIQVLRAIPVIWNDGSAGCPQPNMAYTQALVPGYWVVLGHAGRHYSYHAGRRGTLRLCKNARPTLTGPPPHGRYNATA